MDDHEILLEGLSRLFDRQEEMRVVGTARTVAGAISAARENRPHVVVLDYRLGDEDGTAAVSEIRQLAPTSQVVLLSGVAGTAGLLAAIRAGCAGFVEKSRPFDDLVQAVRLVRAGQSAIPLEHLPELVGAGATAATSARSLLTEREIEVLSLIAAGVPTREQARRLNLSVNTIRTHTQAILSKLGAHSRLEAVAVATHQGLLQGGRE